MLLLHLLVHLIDSTDIEFFLSRYILNIYVFFVLVYTIIVNLLKKNH